MSRLTDMLLPSAVMSLLSGVQDGSFRSFLNSTRYVWPMVLCQANVSCCPVSAGCVNCGGAITTMVIVSVSLNGGVPLSVTRTVTVLVPGVCAGVGVQVNTPVNGLIPAPTGP